MTREYNEYFPYKAVRDQQKLCIEKSLEAFLDNKKRFVIIEAGTGVGKSAIGLTVSRYLNRHMTAGEDYSGGSYFLTTQKILQEQYENDFGMPNGQMQSIYSSSNYKCSYHKGNDCKTSQQLLKTEKKGSAFFKNCALNCTYKKQSKKFLLSTIAAKG